MRDIPLFSTNAGTASLFLKNVSLSESAYVRFLDAINVDDLLNECVDFCKAVGAKHIYISGMDIMLNHYECVNVIAMQANLSNIPTTDAVLVPVTEKTMEQWRVIYNEKMKSVPTAELISYQNSRRYLQDGNCFFVYRGELLLGIGVAKDDQIDAIAAVLPGVGQDVLSALCHGRCKSIVRLSVAETNMPAMTLYNRLGFVKTQVVEKWYKIL